MNISLITSARPPRGPGKIKGALARVSLLAVMCLSCAAAVAVNGVVEINQICAVQLGCFSGDTAGFPVTIDGSAGNSYILTSNLIVSDTVTNVIEVNNRSMSIDLNGFNISSTTCSINVATACPPESGFGSGIITQRTNLSVSGGSITGMGAHGIVALGAYAVIDQVHIDFNRGIGIQVGNYATISNCKAQNNGGMGIRANVSATIKNNIIHLNGSNGIQTNRGSLILDNTSVNNAGAGILTLDGSNVRGNVVRQNGLNGIEGFGDSTGIHIESNSVQSNGGVGIAVDASSAIKGNTVSENVGLGLALGANTTFRENTMVDNGNQSNGGQVSGGVDMGGNYCQDAACP